MDKNILVKDEKYEGKYVAFTSVSDHTVIAVGDDPESVMAEAKGAGIEKPMIVFIPKKDTTFCY